MWTTKSLPSAAYLRDCFILDREGMLTWAARPREHFSTDALWRTQNTRDAGNVAGGPDDRGYLTVRLDGVAYLQHRVVWKMTHEVDPPSELDHKDRSRGRNTPSNLRAADRSLNCINKGVRSDNRAGIKGVGLKGGKWRARIFVAGKSIHLGSFNNAEAAAAAHLSASIGYFGLDAIAPERRERFEQLVIELAADDVRAGSRSIPGFDVVPEQKAV